MSGAEQIGFDALRYTSLILWIVVMVDTANPTWRFLTRRPCHYDMFWAIFFGAAFNRVWFVGRALAFDADGPDALPDMILSYSAYIFGVLIAAGQLVARRWYGDR